MNRNLFDASKYTTNEAKVLPVILLLDVSGSMRVVAPGTGKSTPTGKTVETDGETYKEVVGGVSRIQLLNEAVGKVLATLARQETMGFEFSVSVFTFGETARLHMEPTAAAEATWSPMCADGGTPMGAAIGLAKELIEDKSRIPSRAYRPAVILVSDGIPTDQWETPLTGFVSNGRSSKCDRMAMAIGKECNEDMLQKFIAGTENKLFHGEDAESIHEFFKRVTMSVSMRIKSKDPNKLPSEDDIRRSDDCGPEGSTSEDDEGYW
jgi:uncharacterized protein YegL